MKKLIFLAAACLAIINVQGQECETPISPTGLIAKWKFGNNVADSSGNGHHGTIVGTVMPTTGRSGLANTAMQFTGMGNYVTIPYSSAFNFTSYSICALVKPTVLYTGPCQGNAVIVRGPGSPSDGHWGININDNPYNNCSTADTDSYVFTTYAGAEGVHKQQAVNVHTNTWYCVVATYDNDSSTIYVNGEWVASSPITGSIGTSTDGIGIGADLFPGPGFPFTGSIDEIRLYDRVLTNSEICNFCKHSGGYEPTTAVHDVAEHSYSMSLYPNPAQNILTIAVENAPQVSKQYSIYNTLGQVVANGKFQGVAQRINVSTLPTGLYHIKLVAGNYTAVKQFSVQ